MPHSTKLHASYKDKIRKRERRRRKRRRRRRNKETMLRMLLEAQAVSDVFAV
jgi:hypothetical protein